MPAKSEKQRKFMGMELGKKRAGKGTKTGMSEAQLSDFAKKPKAKGRGKKPAGDMAMLKTMKMPA